MAPRRAAGLPSLPAVIGAPPGLPRRVTFSTFEAGAALVSLIASGGSVDARLTGEADVDTGFGVVPFTFDTRRGVRVLS